METTVQINSSDELLKHKPYQDIKRNDNGVESNAVKPQITVVDSTTPETITSTQEQINNCDDNGAPSLPVHQKDAYDPESIDRYTLYFGKHLYNDLRPISIRCQT